MKLSGNEEVILEGKKYKVVSGELNLFYTNFDESGISKRRHYITSFYKDDYFSLCIIKHNEEISGFIVKVVNTAVIEEVSEVSNLNDKIYKFLNIVGSEFSNEELTRLSADYFSEFCEKEKTQINLINEYDSVARKKSFKKITNLINQAKNDNALNKISGKNLVYDCMTIVASSLDVSLAPIYDILKDKNSTIDENEIARISNIPIRSITMNETFYKEDNGPIIARLIKDNSPIALIPISPRKYKVYDIKNRTQSNLTEEYAKMINPLAYMIYKPFPNKELTIADIFKHGISFAWKRDILRVVLYTFIASAIGLLMPMFNKMIFDDFIPEGDTNQLIGIGLLIASFMVGSFFISLSKLFASFRVTNRMEYGIQEAIFERIMNLPIHSDLIRNLDSGDLAYRSMGITTIFNTLADVVVSVFLGSIFSFLYLWRMFSYNEELAVIGLGMAMATVFISLIVGFVQLRYEKQLIDISNKLSGVLYQFILGIKKIRLTNSHERIVSKYENSFLEGRKINIKKQKMEIGVISFNQLITVIFTVILYRTVIMNDLTISFGIFSAFMVSFGIFSSSMITLGNTFIKVNRLIPIYEKAKPILKTVPEYNESTHVPHEVSGKIEISNLHFKYSDTEEYVISNLNISINSGEYVGIVGTSGSGKSTLLKLLLGFEKPDIGTIFYDDYDINKIDKRELRKKMGVVLQNGSIISGTIMENISINNKNISKDKLDEIIKAVGLQKDIDEMPMGIHTVLSEDGGTISGGQKQRLLIARAIANEPSILFFDEATSSLDNLTQDTVTKNLDKFNITRVIVAHRLSTIIECDRIYVLEKGEVSESGTYNELMNLKGIFYKLAKRQLV